MDRYINPPEKVIEIGRPLSNITKTYKKLRGELNKGEALYAHCNRGLHFMTVCIEDRGDFEHFYEVLYKQGYLLSVEFYAVPIS